MHSIFLFVFVGYRLQITFLILDKDKICMN